MRPTPRLPVFLCATALLAAALAQAKPVPRVAVPDPCPGPVAFAAAELERAATARGLGLQARLVVWPDSSLPSRLAPTRRPESYRIGRDDAGGLVVTGSDPTGVMYGALDLAEQLRWMPRGHGVESVELRRRSPYLELRGVNQFLHQQALDDPNSWWYSETFWREYLDALARSRHNLLDLHALYEMVSTGFPNIFPYLIHLEEYPQADIGREKTARNLAVLNRVIAMAADRGIKVGLMNYNAPAKVPSGKLADYTALCVEKLLRQCPGLWAFGFRIGESGQPEDFFRFSYIAGIKRAERPINLYTRSWIASRAKIMDIAAEHPGRFLVEIKYNGEQLGLPYPVQGERMSGWGSYSYQTYTSKPNNYDILWQVRACGTHRVFQWGDPEFARRVARTCRMGDGAGFSTEPISAYYPLDQYYLNPETFPKPFFQWEFQRNWLWYDVWGRTGYDPTVPDRAFESLYRERYGDRAGRALFRSMLAASKIVPLIFSYHCLGPDHRNMAPEMENGNGHSGRANADGSGERTSLGLQGFLSVEPLDDSVMDSPRRYVDHLVKGEPRLPFGPYEASAALEGYASEALAAARAAGPVSPAMADAYRDQVMDAEALAALARYYAAKTRGVTAMALYQRTGEAGRLDEAKVEIARAIGHWGELSAVTARHFLPLIERLRMYTTKFTWAEEGQDLPQELEELEALRAKLPAAPASVASVAGGTLPVALETESCVPTDRQQVTVKARLRGVPPGAAVTLHHRPMPSFYSWLATPMSRDAAGAYTATVPLTPEGLLYRLGACDPAGRTWQWPDFRAETPYRTVEPWRPRWVERGSVALPEGTPIYTPQVGEAVFSDSPDTIRALPAGLSGLTGLRYPQALLARAQGQAFGGYPISFRVLRTTRLFLALAGPMPAGYGRCAPKALTVGDAAYDVFARDYEPGEYSLVFEQGPIGIILGFRELLAGDPPLAQPSVALAGQMVWELVKSGFVTTSLDFELYDTRIGATVYTDRAYVIKRLPEELQGLIGLRFPNEAGKRGGLVLPFRLDRPATLYVVFGTPEDGPWERPSAGWRLHARDGYQHGLGDEVLRGIYARDYPAGDGALVLRGGTAVVLGFR